MLTEYQKILFPYAYNITGSLDDAKDVVQEVVESYLKSGKNLIEGEKNYLIKGVINRAINSKVRLSKFVSADQVWLPEPIATEDNADRNINLKDILSYSILVLLENLNARERAVFILKESFEYSHAEIAEILSISEEHSRKLLSRAKGKLNNLAASLPKKIAQDDSFLLESYISAIRSRDLKALEELLISDITFYADGGQHLNVVEKRLHGYMDVAQLSILVYHKYLEKTFVKIGQVNHQPALLFYTNKKLHNCQVFTINEYSRIAQICSIVDPEKLNFNI